MRKAAQGRMTSSSPGSSYKEQPLHCGPSVVLLFSQNPETQTVSGIIYWSLNTGHQHQLNRPEAVRLHPARRGAIFCDFSTWKHRARISQKEGLRTVQATGCSVGKSDRHHQPGTCSFLYSACLYYNFLRNTLIVMKCLWRVWRITPGKWILCAPSIR